MTPEQVSRYMKLMKLTKSDNDHEALLALRQAQKISGDRFFEEIAPVSADSIAYDVDDVIIASHRSLEKKIKLLETHIANLPHAAEVGGMIYRNAVRDWVNSFLLIDPDSFTPTVKLKDYFDDCYEHYRHASITLFSRCIAESLNLQSIKRNSGKKGYSVILNI